MNFLIIEVPLFVNFKNYNTEICKTNNYFLNQTLIL